jgi:hypothetical protein
MLARYVDEGDDAEIEYYEDAADRETASIEGQRRRYRGMFRRRMRRRPRA